MTRGEHPRSGANGERPFVARGKPRPRPGPAAALGRHGRGQAAALRRHRRRRARRRLVIGVLAVLVVSGLGLSLTGYTLARRLPSNVERVEGAFSGIDDTSRPEKTGRAINTMNILISGSDARSEVPTTGNAAWGGAARDQRSDVVMLVHLPTDRASAVVVSLPRDSLVPIPGYGNTKLNHAYAYGGPSLLIRTVERLTEIRIDHFAAIDFAGFKTIVDTIGGVDVLVAQATSAGRYRLAAGSNHLDGNRALAYVRERRSLPEGDFDRAKRQQNLIRAILAKAAAINPAREPIKTYRMLDAATRSITVDDTMTEARMRALSQIALDLSARDVSFLSAPTSGTGSASTREGTLSVVHLDEPRCDALWRAIRDDTTREYIEAHQSDLLPDRPR